MSPRGKNAISERTRAQLLAVGIPEAKHEDLAAFFPDEFNIRATELESDDLASVLIYLADKKIISIPRTTSRAMKVKPGWHCCQFYRDFDQLLDMVAPYIAEGLKNGEGCLWVLPTAVPIAAAYHALRKSVDDVGIYLARGQLEILSHDNWYLDQQGRLKSFEEISKALLDKQDLALARGFRFLRAAGDTGWVSGTEQSKSFLDYELKVNEALRSTKVAAMCSYRADVTADEVVAIVTAHQDALNEAFL